MMIVPIVYYSIKEGVGVSKFFKDTLLAVLSSCVAVFVSLGILCIQIGSVKKNFSDGVAHVIYSLGKRTYGDIDDFPIAYTASLESSAFKVVITYLQGTYFNINNYAGGGIPCCTQGDYLKRLSLS